MLCGIVVVDAVSGVVGVSVAVVVRYGRCALGIGSS